MSAPLSSAAERLLKLPIGKTTLTPTINAIRTARQHHPEREFSYARMDGQFVVTRTA